MVVKAAKCLVSVLCVPRQFQPKTAMVRQHLQDEIVSPLSVSLLMNRKNESNSSGIQNFCQKRTEKKVQQCNIKMPPDISNQCMPKASTITHKAEVVSPVSENIFDDRKINNDYTSDYTTNYTSKMQDKEEAKKKIQEYINTLKSGDFKSNQHSKEGRVLTESKLPNSQINNSSSTTAIQGHSGEDSKKVEQWNITLNPAVSKKTEQCNITLNPAVSKPIPLKASTIKMPQHLKDEVVSTLAGNIFVNRTANKTDNDPIKPTIQDPSGEEMKKNAQKGNTVVTDFPKLFQANASSVKMKQFKEEKIQVPIKEININCPITSRKKDPCGGDPIMKVHMRDVTIKPSDNTKKGKSVASASNKEYLTLNASPPLPEKHCVAMDVRFNLGVQAEKELKECKIMPKCQNQRGTSAKSNARSTKHIAQGPISSQFATKASISSAKPIACQQPKSK